MKPCEMETCEGCEHFEVDCDGDNPSDRNNQEEPIQQEVNK